MSAFEKGDQWDLEWKILYWSIHLGKLVLNFGYNLCNEGKEQKNYLDETALILANRQITLMLHKNQCRVWIWE